MIKLYKPLIFFDLETTGISVIEDRVIELAAVKLNPDNSREILNLRFDPEGRRSTPEALSKHGIKDIDLLDEPTFKEKSTEIFDFFKECDLAGYNVIRFDIPMLTEELIRAGILFDPSKASVIDVYKIWNVKEPKNLESAFEYFTGNTMSDAHQAEADTNATIDIFEAQLAKYADLNTDVETIEKDCSYENDKNKNKVDFAGKIVLNNNGEEVFGFGKYKDKLVQVAIMNDMSYIDWIIKKSDFTRNTKLCFYLRVQAYKKEQQKNIKDAIGTKGN